MILKDLVIELAEPKAPARTILRANNNAGWSIGTECGCQKLTVDKILNAALPWIAEQPVRLKGALKNDQKIHFEAKCAAKRREWLDWSATMSMDGQVPTLAEYWEWKAEEDGGVWLDGSGVVVAKSIGEELDGIKDVEAAHENNDELALEKCRCKVMCTPGLWTNED
ncbi:hypothetical protein CERZMDRAFT_90750 [Cercospora zeae-maydis SCOH1-5]|uniref:Uncharacterized protein n=1 Tax=Cercospora zeae-maydis SCOH1-5 TaxID=717836 RepID=A0A6A6FG51_9PEZI|nr:hypothetical protein CERZMDRAFT_90750 [Cercospora zeae-maydis SCOH1-5]